MAEERKKELVLPPGTYCYILDSTKGQVRLHVGPINVNMTGQDKAVVFDHKKHTFVECSLEQALQQSVVVPESYYSVLINPAKDNTGKLVFPSFGRLQDPPDLLVGI